VQPLASGQSAAVAIAWEISRVRLLGDPVRSSCLQTWISLCILNQVGKRGGHPGGYGNDMGV
jgi:hypothetical protein